MSVKVTVLLVDDSLTEQEIEIDLARGPDGWARGADDGDQEWFETVLMPALIAQGHDPELVEDWEVK